MNILIAGDSYGVPSSHINTEMLQWWNNVDKSNSPAENHIHCFLEKDHVVNNISISGTSAKSSISKLSTWLIRKHDIEITYSTHHSLGINKNPDIKYDLLIYFQPPIMRDFHTFDNSNTVRRQMLETAHGIYKDIALLCEKSNIPNIALIGGAGRVYPFHTEYLSPQYYKEDWKAEILGWPEPFYAQTLGGLPTHEQLVEKNTSTEFITDLMNNHYYVINAMAESDRFPDNAHPDALAHEQLYLELKHKFNL